MTTQEGELMKELLTRANLNPPFDLESELLVSEMNDGNMGSLYLYPPGITENKLHPNYQYSSSFG